MANLCFWNGILSKLNDGDFKFANFYFNKTKDSRVIFLIEQLKSKNTICKQKKPLD